MDGEGLLLAGGGSMNIGNPITANRVGVWIKKVDFISYNFRKMLKRPLMAPF